MNSTMVSDVQMLYSRLGRSTVARVQADIAHEIAPGIWMLPNGTFEGFSLRLRAVTL